MPENSKQNYYKILKIALYYPLFSAKPFRSIAGKYV
jgi:hypothetical protein